MFWQRLELELADETPDQDMDFNGGTGDGVDAEDLEISNEGKYGFMPSSFSLIQALRILLRASAAGHRHSQYAYEFGRRWRRCPTW